MRAGHALEPKAIESVRGDTFVVETNIHYPTESSVIGDGLRKIVTLAAELAADQGLGGWRQHKHLLKKVRSWCVRLARRRAPRRRRADRLQAGLQETVRAGRRPAGSVPGSCWRRWASPDPTALRWTN